MPKESEINFEDRAIELATKYGEGLEIYKAKRHSNKINQLAGLYNEYVIKAQKEVTDLIKEANKKLVTIKRVEATDNAFEYLEREQRNYLDLTEKRRAKVLNELNNFKNTALSGTNKIVKSQGKVAGNLKEELKGSKNKTKINDQIKKGNKIKSSMSASKRNLPKAFDGIRKAIRSLELEVKEVRMNLAMKGIQTEGTLLDAIYDEENESGIYGTLRQIRAYLVETENSKLSVITRDTQKYLDLVNTDPNGLVYSFGKLEAAAKLDLPKAVAKVGDKKLVEDKKSAKEIVKELKKLSMQRVAGVVQQILKEYIKNTEKTVTEENLGEKTEELKTLKNKIESVGDGQVIKNKDDMEKIIEDKLRKEKLDVATFSNVTFNLFKIMVFSELYRFLLRFAQESKDSTVSAILYGIAAVLAVDGCLALVTIDHTCDIGIRDILNTFGVWIGCMMLIYVWIEDVKRRL